MHVPQRATGGCAQFGSWIDTDPTPPWSCAQSVAPMHRSCMTCSHPHMCAAGVHQIATLRVLADAAGAGAPLRASATSTYDAARGLSDPDTLVGFVEWESGLRTGISITLAAAFVRCPRASAVIPRPPCRLLYKLTSYIADCCMSFSACNACPPVRVLSRYPVWLWVLVRGAVSHMHAARRTRRVANGVYLL